MKNTQSGIEKVLEEFDEKFKYQDDLDQDEDIKLFLQAKIKKAWIDGFMETGEGYNGEYCSGHGGNDVTREEVAKIYDETLSII